jgi:hypothetical protein
MIFNKIFKGRIFTFLGRFFSKTREKNKLRKVLICYLITTTIYLSTVNAASAGNEVDAFSQQQQPHRTNSEKRGIFRRFGSDPGNPNNNNNGSGDGSGGNGNNPRLESIEKTQNRVDSINENVRFMKDMKEDKCDIHDRYLNDGSILTDRQITRKFKHAI